MTTETISASSDAVQNLDAGQKIGGCYVLERLLETGGEHPIWLAQDEVLGKEVTLHFLPEVVARDAGAMEELRHEVKRNRALIHPGVLRVYDLVEGTDMVAVAMETFEARCLAEILAEQGQFEVEDLEPWLDQVCITLEEAHRIKLIHRDLAPQNIFVTAQGRLLLANFGISRVVQDALRRAGGRRRESSRLYTLSPQLLAGASPSVLDDVYGVGVLFQELLTGQPILSGGDVAEKIRRITPQRISEVRAEVNRRGEKIPPSWENVIAACLNKRGDERPQRPSEIVSSIEAYRPPAESLAARTSASDGLAEEDLATEVEPIRSELVEEDHAREAEKTPLDQESVKSPKPEPDVPREPAMVLPVEPRAEVITEPVAGAAMEAVTEPVVEAAAEPVVEAAAEPVVEVAAEPVVGAPAEPVAEAAAVATESFKAGPVSEEPAPPGEGALKAVAFETPAKDAAIKQELEKVPAVSESKPSRSRPTKRYDTEEDAFSAILPRRFRFPAAVAAVVALLLLLINGFFNEAKDGAPPPAITTSDSPERSELTSVNNSLRALTLGSEPSSRPPSAALTPEPTPSAPKETPENPELLVAAGSSPTAPAPTASTVSEPSPAVLSDKQIAERSKELERLKQELASAEKTHQARLKEQQAAAAALAEAQKAIDDKTKTAGQAKKAADELLATRKKREEEQQSAEAAARAAQQLAAEKVRLAEVAKKALADFEAENREKLAAQERMESEIQTLQKTLSDRQKIAEESAKMMSGAEAARQEQLAKVQQTEQEILEAKANVAKNSAEADHQRQAMEAERRKLDDEISAMKALFEQKMKDIEDRRRQISSGPIAPAVAATKPVPPTSVDLPPPQKAAPAPSLPLMALKTETPKPEPIVTPIAEKPSAAAIAPVASSSLVNSLGMKFAPVGDVLFCVWQTRVKDFEAFAKAVNLKSTAWRGPGFRQGPDHPVVNVTWTEAIAFCKWLTDKEHKEGTLAANQFYRLPYDLEWSKAVLLPDETGRTPEARDMGVPDVYPWGTEWPPTKGAGNYTGEETGSDVAIKGFDDGFAWTAPVGSFPPNKLGLYDMGGNVWQWCMDSWNTESKAKVLRGASWYNGALKLSLLSSCRVHAAPDSSTDNYGFRIARGTETVAGKMPRR